MPQLISINPSNYQMLGELNSSTLEEIKAHVKLAHEVKHDWRELGVRERVKILRNAFEEFKRRKQEIILQESMEMGTPIIETESNFNDSINYVNWNFDIAEKYLSPEITFETAD